MASGSYVYSGHYWGAGAALSVNSCPFRPKAVEIINMTDGDVIVKKWESMPGAQAVSIIHGGAGVTDIAVQATLVTITNDGFDLANDAIVTEDGKQYSFNCWG